MYVGSLVGQQRIGSGAMEAVSLMIPPETANVGAAPGCRPAGFLVISGPRPSEGRPGRGGEAGVGQRTREVARTLGRRPARGSAGDSAAAGSGRDGPAARLGHGEPPLDWVPLRVAAAAGKDRRDVAGDRPADSSSPRHAGGAHDAAELWHTGRELWHTGRELWHNSRERRPDGA